tara:strand:- start:3029 stop:3565 length:537 start_codon:yes stop_codon:yes gene_type:complete
MRGGYDRMELRALNKEGNIELNHEDEFEGQFDDVLGNHTGTAAANNVYNARPDHKYYHGRITGQNSRSRVRALLQKGFEIVREEDEESLGDMSDLDLAGTNLDTTLGANETVLLRCREDRYRLFREEKAQVAQREIESASSGEEFLGKDDISGGRYAQNKVVYNRQTEHGLTFGERID